jgi:phage tail-like protein
VTLTAKTVERLPLPAGENLWHEDILIQLINEAGQIVIAYKVHRCWPSEYVALPDLDANATDVAFEQLILQNEGWERDTSVAEPQEPSF